MAASQQHVTPQTPVGATLIANGATFRAYAPAAHSVHVALFGPGLPTRDQWKPGEDNKLVRHREGYWAGFFPGVQAGALYRFYTIGPGGKGFKRDPRALELELRGYPDVDCIVSGGDPYPWHDQGFQPPPFHELIIYQFHVGVFYANDGNKDIRKDRVSKFLDVLDRLEYLAALGVNAVQPLPVVEWQSEHSRGYNDTDFFSPEMDYALTPQEVAAYLPRINALLHKKGKPALVEQQLYNQRNQLKALVDLFHVYGIAVLLDVVYNHAGGPLDAESMRFFDQPADQDGKAPDLYFIGGEGWAGGRIFNYRSDEVQQFLIDNAKLFLDEYHVDGFRYDEVTVIYWNRGKQFCQHLTDTLHFHKPKAIHIAEYWDWDRATPVLPVPTGLGFDAAVHDGLRIAIRQVIGEAAAGTGAYVNMTALRNALYRPAAFPAAWRAVVHVENHDLVDDDRDNRAEIQPRMSRLADANNPRSWYARSRSRVATGLVLTAPGIPMLFMGQEFLEDKSWHNNPGRDDLFIYWEGLKRDPVMRDFLRFTQELCRLRRRHPALQGEGLNPYYVHDANRVLAFQRWQEGVGRDVIVVVSLGESTYREYQLPFPAGGYWHEVFNSDAYDSMPSHGSYNPNAAGNPWGVTASGPPMEQCPTSATIVLPANGLLIFARDLGN